MLVTGGTGKVGGAVVRAARAAGHEVRVLVRDVDRAGRLLPPGVTPVLGDVTDPASLAAACDGCEVVFNAMGLPEQWLADPSRFDRVNVEGSVNVARAAAAAGVRRLVHTSTVDVFDAPPGGRFDETCVATAPKLTAYERSKQRAEQALLALLGTPPAAGGAAGKGAAGKGAAGKGGAARAARTGGDSGRAAGRGATGGISGGTNGGNSGGTDVVFANAATVYGLGPTGPASMETQLFRLVLRGLLPAVPPGGFGVVFTEGLAQGHLLAAEHGRPGERYIFCDEHATLMRLAHTVVEATGRGRPPLMTIPTPVAKAMAAAGEAVARVTRRPPPLARGQLQYLLWNAVPDATKARKELGWQPTPLAEGIRRTVVETGL